MAPEFRPPMKSREEMLAEPASATWDTYVGTVKETALSSGALLFWMDNGNGYAFRLTPDSALNQTFVQYVLTARLNALQFLFGFNPSDTSLGYPSVYDVGLYMY